MNTAIALGIGLQGVVFLILGFVVALRAKRQFGFLSPIGFMCAVVLSRICWLLTLPMINHLGLDANQEKLTAAASRLGDEGVILYSGLSGQAQSIWGLGTTLFLLCGLLDMKAHRGASSITFRLVLVVGGTLIISFSAIYPFLMFWRLQ